MALNVGPRDGHEHSLEALLQFSKMSARGHLQTFEPIANDDSFPLKSGRNRPNCLLYP